MNLRTTNLTQSRSWLSPTERKALAQVISASFEGIDAADYLAKYFDDPAPYERKLRLFSHGEQLVGYCLLTFSDEAGAIIIRASAGFLPAFRRGGNTYGFSIRQSVAAWLRRPWRRVYYADTMLSPAMYRAIAKHSGIIWPHFKHTAPAELFERFNPAGQTDADGQLRCLVDVGRTTRYSEQEIAGLTHSDKPEIQFYCRINPEFVNGVALFVIMPVNLAQMWRLLLKNLRGR